MTLRGQVPYKSARAGAKGCFQQLLPTTWWTFIQHRLIAAACRRLPYTDAMRASFVIVIFAISANVFADAQQKEALPIIDMHLHAMEAVNPPIAGGCVPVDAFPAWDAKQSPKYVPDFQRSPCANSLTSPPTDDELMNE